MSGDLSSSGMLNMSSLLSFIVGDNHMSGSIQKDFCTHSANLQVLGLLKNQFEGDISSVLISCRSLQILSMEDNKFRGTILPSIANLTRLVRLGIRRNNFEGTILPSIANLTNLVWFSIAENNFQGRIPSEIGHLSNLKILDVSFNELNGEVAPSIFNLSKLETIGLHSNNFSGKLPFSIDKGLPNIEDFNLGSNKFDGNIPYSISNLSRLTLLQLSNNSFTGHMPTTLGYLPRLRFLNLWGNDFTNNLSIPQQDFLSSFSASNSLQTIQISFNPITGQLPKSLGSSNLSASLLRFNAARCQIRSPIPNEIGNLTNLISLVLGFNHLAGPIPPALGNLRSMQTLYLHENKLQGSIPAALCNLPNLYSLALFSNYLSGQLPTCWVNLSSLRGIYLDNNVLNFSIPTTPWINEHVEMIYLSNNFLHGSIPPEIGNIKDLRELVLSGNQLSGQIPTPISQLQKLIFLNLSNNKLDGPILDSFSNLMDLQNLDLSQNRLSGPIPRSLEKLVSLVVFNVSCNQLSGEIPNGGPFLNFTPESFLGNEGLCGVPRFKVEACKRSNSTKNKLLKLVLPVIASVVVAVTILILVIMRLRRRNLPPSSIDTPLAVNHERISYYAILHATGNLNEENLIGKGSFGSVYKGIFSDAMVAAVKVFNLEVQGAFRSFDTECQILRSIRHRNLVKVITCCTNLDFKALVMAYMPNGNLEKWLYSDTCSLNILQRLKIMMDVASAVEYLHEGYSFPIVHCDLKPSNILLDEDMVAHVGDFGIAKLLTEEQRMKQTKILGTIGYIAPEYGSQGVVSTMVDVYSYGILLMETLTRRKPTDEMFSGEFTMRRWMSESFPASIMQIVDEEFVNIDDHRRDRIRERHERCLTSIVEVALQCTTEMAEERPKMKDIHARMRKIYSNLSTS